MDFSSTILHKLSERIPLFESHPTTTFKQICGTEQEFGVNVNEDASAIVSQSLPFWTENGGAFFKDNEHHVEAQTPEETNPATLAIRHHAMRDLAVRMKLSERLFANNRTIGFGNACDYSYGLHENIWTKSHTEDWYLLIPFLVSRVLINGSGYFDRNGKFQMSQRADFLSFDQSTFTTADYPNYSSPRGILCTRVSESKKGRNRLHIICGDNNIAPIATLLSFGYLSLIVELLEIGALPDIGFTPKESCADLQRISKSVETTLDQENWYLRCARKEISAIDVLMLVREAGQRCFGGRDPVTDTILIILNDTIVKLRRNPMELYGRLDWITKGTMVGQNGDSNPVTKASLDLAYHDLTGLGMGRYLLKSGHFERLASKKVMTMAAEIPPMDTRAYFRGKLVKGVSDLSNLKFLYHSKNWQQCIVSDFHGHSVHIAQIEDPFNTYGKELETLLQSLRSINDSLF
jgi:Pup amidohydrolase